ncbi:uncharacterized protein [Aegilops tauschii subsp. strangulata]|uniref:uncharacterized protein n=1 Tax=Aegilops tauschii subsp. strangulata TaxID=200361 RepID=UPI003CC8580E
MPPPRQSARQAAQKNTTPVAERATLRLVKGLGLLGPKEKMTAKAAEALIRRFDEPLSGDDINVIAKLTRLNKEAMRVAVGMAGPEAEAEEAGVWNIRGLNTPARRTAVRQIAEAQRANILCLQETKLESWTPSVVRELGGARLDGCAVLPAIDTRGGIAVLWDKSMVNFVTHAVGNFSITGKVSLIQDRLDFWLTTVYGPVDDTRKDDFLAEIAHAAPPQGEPWLLNGDFNIIYEARDKNNLNLNRRIMGMFRAAIDRAGLREIKCKNGRFTWTNERQNPTMETVERAWQRPVNHTCPIIRLKKKMHRTTHDLKIWAKTLFSDAKVQFHLALERSRKRQASRLTWLKAGDARTAFFQAKINSRRRKNFIHSLQTETSTVTAHEEKKAIAHDHFANLLGKKEERRCSINWEELDMPNMQNEGLDNPFSEPEVWAAIMASPSEKAPGPNGFSGTFFRACWGTIKNDVMAVFDHFYNLAEGDFAEIN